MPEAREAAHGQRMIEVRVRFWTNNLAKSKGMVLPRNAWGSQRHSAASLGPRAEVSSGSPGLT
jgi:hypothetical protein